MFLSLEYHEHNPISFPDSEIGIKKLGRNSGTIVGFLTKIEFRQVK